MLGWVVVVVVVEMGPEEEELEGWDLGRGKGQRGD